MIPRRIILYVILPALVIYLGVRCYLQYRPIKIYVVRVAPMPAELANGLHMEEHKINPMVRIESPYEGSEEKIPSMEEIRRIRSQIAWSWNISPVIDALIVQAPDRVMARHTTARFIQEYQLVKEGDHWAIESATRSEIVRNQAAKN